MWNGGWWSTLAGDPFEPAPLDVAVLGAQPFGFCQGLASEFKLSLFLIKRVKLEVQFALAVCRKGDE